MSTEYGGTIRGGSTILLRQRVFFDDFQATPKSGQVRIQRDSDSKYWNGSTYVTSETWVATTVNASQKEHSYSFVAPNPTSLDYLTVTMRINNDVLTEEPQRFFFEVGNDIITVEIP